MAYKKYNPEAAKEKRTEDTKRLSELIKTEIESFKEDPENIAEYLKFASRFYRYSPINQILIMLQNSGASFVGSYQYFKKEGYSVLQGEKGIQIFVPAFTKICSLPDEFEGTKLYSELTSKEKSKIDRGGGKVEEKITFKIGNVFDISQTNCPKEDYPKIFDRGVESMDHKLIYSAVLDYAKNNGIVINESSVSEIKSISVRGYYSADSDTIVVRGDLTDTQKLATLIHEIGHREMHNLNMGSAKPSAVKEFEADGYTVMLSEALGIPTEDGTKQHMHTAYKELIKDIPAIQSNETVFSTLDKNAELMRLEEKDMIERSLQEIVAQYNVAQKTMIPHVKEYVASHSIEVKSQVQSLGAKAVEARTAVSLQGTTPVVQKARVR